jgi:2-amino-4-hydroxy-6-hydroxymethyldihydropteridine diphosphokinase
MARVFIGIGTNVGDRAANMELARVALADLPRTRLAGFSKVYETEPVGPVAQGEFFNAAAELDTQLDPYDLLDALARIEGYAGRTPRAQRVKWGPRTLDLDILLYENRVISSDELIVPHPLMHERWFVLKPLADLAPQAVHPVLEMTVADLLRDVEEKQR